MTCVEELNWFVVRILFVIPHLTITGDIAMIWFEERRESVVDDVTIRYPSYGDKKLDILLKIVPVKREQSSVGENEKLSWGHA